MHVAHIPEVRVPGKRLGRHVEHDERSRMFAMRASTSTPVHSVAWERHCAPYDQGDLGSCTGNAMAGLLMTGPFFRPGRILTENDAIALYEAATQLDTIPGHYPPTDTGSSGLAVAKAAKKAGYIESYHHAFSLRSVLVALQVGPVICGANWYEGFDQPKPTTAELVPEGEVRGGHEFCLVGVDVDLRLVRMCNSWGAGWGDHGYATLSYATLERLLAERGDVTVCR